MISASTSRRTVKTIALFEAAKGLLVLSAGFGLLSLLHQDVQAAALRLIHHLHLHPSRKLAGIFIRAATNVTDKELLSLATFAVVYSSFRLIEGYGLWKQRGWAEWLAVVSGMIYLPFEIYEMVTKFTLVHVTVLAVNLIVVDFLVMVLWRSIKTRSSKTSSV